MGILFVIVNGAQVIFSLLNLFLFFRMSKIRLSKKQRKTQHEFRKQMASVPKSPVSGARHKCAICGRTELDDPNLTFRFCSKCTGNKEYCQDHLFTHTHNQTCPKIWENVPFQLTRKGQIIIIKNAQKGGCQTRPPFLVQIMLTPSCRTA